jgi:MoaA/NifB/PqqE/SkfB family radical SAM enzyme
MPVPESVAVQKHLTKLILTLLWRMLFITLKHPVNAVQLIRIVVQQRHYARQRKQFSTDEVGIPPFAIYSITKKCNLKCAGCYAKVHQENVKQEMSIKQVRSLFLQAQELGIGIFFLAGGEPLLRRDIMDLTGAFPKLLFLVFTNGLLLDKAKLKTLHSNVVPILSLEGDKISTNERRGEDVFSILQTRFEVLEMYKRLWGVSITVTSENLEEVTDPEFVQKLIRHDCMILFYVEYVPINAETDHLVLNTEQQNKLKLTTEMYRKRYAAAFVAFPGDEEKWAGCLAAGRGFVHIQADGAMEPCPFAPYSDSNVTQTSLSVALQSSYLRTLRKKHHLLHETKGGCALWANREAVKQLLEDTD